jgi:capsular polysaccharide export protein
VTVLFLQGPMGPFFRKLITKLRDSGTDAFKINFNGGDAWYSRGIDAVPFMGTESEWPDFLRNFINDNNIRSICVYGDCRRYHRAAKSLADELGLSFYAFEEGYIRPNRLTFERNGVNGYSEIAIEGLPKWQDEDIESESVMGGTLMNRAFYCSVYYNVSFLTRFKFPHYVHHRSFSPVNEAFCWLRALARNYLYKVSELGIQKRLVEHHSGHYFLVPLQVFNDAQIQFHSPYEKMEDFIRELMISFAEHGCAEDVVVFKHHPMDRGHCNYAELIAALANELGLAERVEYCHDQHLPTLLEHAKGVITINSTASLSAFYHKASVKVMGDAFYDIKGLCSQQTLKDFWQRPEDIDYDLFLRLRNFLVHHGQVNGSYYRKHALTIDALIAEMRTRGILDVNTGGEIVRNSSL